MYSRLQQCIFDFLLFSILIIYNEQENDIVFEFQEKEEEEKEKEVEEEEEEELSEEIFINQEAIKYESLQESIDKLVYSNEINLLYDSVTAMASNVERLKDMRKQITNDTKRRNDGIKLATDVRSFISKNILQNLVTPLGMAQVET